MITPIIELKPTLEPQDSENFHKFLAAALLNPQNRNNPINLAIWMWNASRDSLLKELKDTQEKHRL